MAVASSGCIYFYQVGVIFSIFFFFFRIIISDIAKPSSVLRTLQHKNLFSRFTYHLYFFLLVCSYVIPECT